MPQFERDGVWLAVPRPIVLDTVIRDALLNALAFTEGAQASAAGLLGISPRKMGYQMIAHGIPVCDASSGRRRGHARAKKAAPR
jgi:Bacterial regulatory protein, Fis family